MDFDRVFERAGQRGVMIEINGNPNRLDIDWRIVLRVEADATLETPILLHRASYNDYEGGTWVARKAGLSPKEIFNTRPVEEVEEYLTLRSRASGGRAGSRRPSRKG
jgi:DNA polymerase (family 10)